MANTPNLDLVKPAGTDHALVSVINSNNDKIDSGFGTLSEQIATYSFGDKTVSAFETALDTFCASMTDGEYKHVWVHITTASGVFAATNYTGFVECNLSSRWNILLAEQASGITIRGCKTSSGWIWQQLADKVSTKTFDTVNDFNNITSKFYDSVSFTASGTARSNLPMSSNASMIVNGAGNDVHLICIRANGEIYIRNKTSGTWDEKWEPIPNLLVNESLDAGTSKTYSFSTGRLYQIMCAHPYGQGYFAIYAGGPAGAARLTEIKTSSNVTVAVASNANSVTITATGQATYVRIIEY